MIRKPTYAGTVQEKDDLDILYWATCKSPAERLQESWRLNCLNHNIPLDSRMNRNVGTAKKRDNG